MPADIGSLGFAVVPPIYGGDLSQKIRFLPPHVEKPRRFPETPDIVRSCVHARVVSITGKTSEVCDGNFTCTCFKVSDAGVVLR